jgi:hypothetical protein
MGRANPSSASTLSRGGSRVLLSCGTLRGWQRASRGPGRARRGKRSQGQGLDYAFQIPTGINQPLAAMRVGAGGPAGRDGRVAPGDCSPGAPTDPYVQDYRIRFLKQPLRFSHGLRTTVMNPLMLSAGVSLTRSGSTKPPPCCLPAVWLPDSSLPSPGSLGRLPRFPRYYQGATTSCRPSRRTSFSFVWRYHGNTHVSLPLSLRVNACGPGVGYPVSPSGFFFRGDDRISHVPGGPRLCLCPARRPRRTGTSGHYDVPTRPPF